MSLYSRSSSSGGSSEGRANKQPNWYYAYLPPPSVNRENDPLNYIPVTAHDVYDQDQGRRKIGSASVQNRALNLNIPCAFSYTYDLPIPPEPKQPQTEQHQRRPFSSNDRNSLQNQKKLSFVSGPHTFSKSSLVSSLPFHTTVKGGELFKAKEIPSAMKRSSSSRLRNKCSVTWDLSCGQRQPFRVVDYGQELYEQAAQNLANRLHEQKLADMKSLDAYSEVEGNCYDFSKPGMHSGKHWTKALERAVESLKDVPREVEAILTKDKRFQPSVLSRTTKVLNVSRNSKVYNDLIPVDLNPDVHTEMESIIQTGIRKSIEAVRLPSRAKDSEPQLDNYQSNSYTRMRPSVIHPPLKLSTGISFPTTNDFDAIQSDNRLQVESNQNP